MGRPRKYPLPGDVTNPHLERVAVSERAAAPAPPPPELDDEPEEDAGPLDPEQLVALALDSPRMKLTPEMVVALSQAWKDNVRADDDEGKAHARRIAARLKRATHPELHPGCQKVKIFVPVLKRSDGRGGLWHIKINERVYVGNVEVWECTARQILQMVHHYQQIEAERMSEDRMVHPTHDLDTGTTILERAAAIRRA
jgi:hypothetical protein